MNILFVTATYPPNANGVAILTRRFAVSLTEAGHTVGIIGPATSVERHAHIRYFPFPAFSSMVGFRLDYPIGVPLYWHHTSSLDRTKWDIVHSMHPSMYMRTALALQRRYHIPVIFTYNTQYEFHANALAFLTKRMNALLYKREVASLVSRMNGIIAPSLWMKELLVKKYPNVNIYHVPSNSVPDDFDRVDGKKEIPFLRPRILLAMRLSPEKNIEFAIRAFRLWRRQHSRGTLLIVGVGPQEVYLQHLVQRLGMNKYVYFLGKQSNNDMAFWFRSSDVLLYPSVSEVAPLTILEAMASGLPIVALNHGAVTEFITHKKTGIIAESTVAAFANGISDCLKKQTYFSNAARRIATSQLFSQAHATQQLLHVYQQVRDVYTRPQRSV